MLRNFLQVLGMFYLKFTEQRTFYRTKNILKEQKNVLKNVLERSIRTECQNEHPVTIFNNFNNLTIKPSLTNKSLLKLFTDYS